MDKTFRDIFISKKKSFSLAIFIIGIFSLIIFDNVYNVFATTDNSNNNDKRDKKFQLNVIINLNNIKQENPQLLKLIAFINGDIQTKIIDLKKNATISKNSQITTPFYFNTSNEVSQLNVGDEYFVCGYIVKKNDNVNSSSNNNQPILPYDCNEGGIASTSKDSIGLFSTMNKFSESLSIYQASSKMSPSSLSSPSANNSTKVKITLLNPLDAKKIKDLDNVQFTAMVKGEYQIKKMDIKNEIKNLRLKIH